MFRKELSRSFLLCLSFLTYFFSTCISSNAQIQIFSAPMVVPEDIVLVPTGFGIYGGNYFVPDDSTGNIWVVPHTGGAPSELLSAPLTGPNFHNPVGGIFLPNSWGDSNAGKFIVPVQDQIFAVAGDKSVSVFPNQGGALTDEAVAPAGFGAHAGRLLVTDENGVIWSFGPNGSVMKLVDNNPQLGAAFGTAFAPAGFGNLAGKLLVSDAGSSAINAVSSDGSVSHFANVPLNPGQTGLRQMAFAPIDYFSYLGARGDVLLVSVSGSRFGGGSLGSVLGLDSNGNVVVHLIIGGVLQKFDPRGLLFTDSGNLLISDTSDPLLIAHPSNFGAGPESVPEPGVMAFLFSGMAAIFFRRVRRTSRNLGIGPDRKAIGGCF